MSPPANNNFAPRLLGWYDQYGRKDLPWQQEITAYRVWISEIMLQQTQVNTVIPYYLRFMQHFASVEALATATQDEVMHLWSGLGYYSRARNLHAAAQRIVDAYAGQLPNNVEALQSLPGIGRSTAGAICAIAFNAPCPILDGNVKRVLARHFAVTGWPGVSGVAKQLWVLAECCTPDARNRDYTQAIMDLGATVCTRSAPDCTSCPVQSSCAAYANQSIGDFPGKKPRKTLPQKQTQLMIIENQRGEILLYKKPPSGVWGGLWSLPEASQIDASMQLREAQHWPVLRHTFSHYHLDITPVHCVLEQFDGIMDSSEQHWYNLQEPAALGIAAPISKLLQEFAARQAQSS